MKIVQILLDMKLGLIALGAAAAALGIAVWFSLMAEVRLAESQMEEIVHLEAELHREIGYGGLIHNFKNYVLRGSGNYRTAAQRNYERAVALLDRLDHLIDVDGQQHMATVRATLEAYRDNLEVAAAAHAQGLGARDIDQQVKIDDSLAIHALGVRMRATYLALTFERDALREAQEHVFVALCLFFGATLLILFVIVRGVFHRLRALEVSPAPETAAAATRP